jgi:SAM-dependent methyltransferase
VRVPAAVLPSARMTPRTPPPDPSSPARFDARYFRRHYHGRDRAHSAAEIGRLASGVCGLAEWLGVSIERVLDAGAGTGLWRSWFRRHRPAVRYRSIDVSPYACARYGHELRDVSRWRARERFDLVICHSVLQYLDDDAAARAIRNLGAMCGGLLYLEAITRADLAVLDLDRTDTVMHLRTGAWYRARLDRHFVQVGAGLWAARRSGVRLYDLEGPPRRR